MNTSGGGPRGRGPRKPIRASTSLKVSDRTLANLKLLFKMLADESRLKILFALAQDRELHVNALCKMLNEAQPSVSHHLTLLRLAGLVDARRDGRHSFYRTNSVLVRELLEQCFTDMGNGTRQLQFADFCLTYRRK